MTASESSRRGSAWLGVAALVLVSSPAEVYAGSAVDGQIGSASRSSVQIKVSIAPQFGVERRAPVPSSGSVNVSGAMQPFCIWSNAPVQAFSLRASQAPLEGAGTAGRGEASTYQLEWRPSGSSEPLVIRPGQAIAGLAAQPVESCKSRDRPAKSLLVVKGAAGGPSSSLPGRTLLLLISPD